MSTRKLRAICPIIAALLLAPLLLPSPATATDTKDTWQAPVAFPVAVGKEFEPPEIRWLSGHRGVDLCPGVGATVRAPRAGNIIYAGKLADRNVVSIRHSDGTSSTFEPVIPAVSKGASVSAGTIVGVLEEGHDGNCLHWGIKVNRDLYLNPLGLLVGTPVLKPLGAPGA
ncbi:MAG: M23 family metallopeptidase [Actinomycetaceae bacterium]|nr:M23 family metallopeptidase [Actinomycetaceae bacterium]